MDNAFTEAASRWHDFYVLAGGASATLIGLLFVGVSIHIDMMAHEKAKALRQIAGQLLFNFVYVIVIALTMVSPAVNNLILAVVLLVIGSTGFVRLISRAVAIMRVERNWFKEELRNPINSIAHIVLPGACFLTVIASGLMLLVSPEQMSTVFLLVMITVMYLIVRAIVDVWTLLIQLAVFKRSRNNTLNALGEQSVVQEHAPL
jgi:hypothetical protein